MKKVWQSTWIYKTYKSIKSYREYRKDRKNIKGVFYSDEFALVLNQYLNLNVKKDWIGRLYGVINPVIDSNGFLDISNSIIEIDGENTNSNNYVEFWLYRQLDLMKNLFDLHNLYDYIDVTTQKVGPITADNYLIVFDIVSRQEFTKNFKKWLKTSGIYLGVAAIVAGLIIVL